MLKMRFFLLICFATPCLAAPIKALKDADVIAMTIYMEARGEGAVGMKAVASVIHNRAKNVKHRGLRKVCLAPYQFSAWNGKSAVKLPKDKEYRFCKFLAHNLLNAKFVPNHSFTHYYNPSLCSPRWATAGIKIGNHVFCKA